MAVVRQLLGSRLQWHGGEGRWNMQAAASHAAGGCLTISGSSSKRAASNSARVLSRSTSRLHSRACSSRLIWWGELTACDKEQGRRVAQPAATATQRKGGQTVKAADLRERAVCNVPGCMAPLAPPLTTAARSGLASRTVQ